MKLLSVLIGDDDDLIGELLGELLVEMGHEVCAIERTAKGVIAAARHFVPDLMIIDLHLADGSGIDAVDEIVRALPIASILVSGSIMKLTALKPDAITLGKPYNQVGLTLAIQRAVDRERCRPSV